MRVASTPPPAADGSLTSHTVSAPLGTLGTQLRILQLDHAGIDCDNWQLSNVSILSPAGEETNLNASNFLCVMLVPKAPSRGSGLSQVLSHSLQMLQFSGD